MPTGSNRYPTSTTVERIVDVSGINAVALDDGEFAYCVENDTTYRLEKKRPALPGAQPAFGGGFWNVFDPSGALAASAGVVIYRPNAPSYTGNVYPTFADAYAASEDGGTILVDDVFGPASIGPPGAFYDLSERAIGGFLRLSFNSGSGTPVAVLQGVKLKLSRVFGILQLLSQSTLPIVDSATPLGQKVQLIFLTEGSTLVGSANAPFVDIAPGGNAQAFVIWLGGQIGDGLHPAVRVGQGSAAVFLIEGSAQVASNSLQGPVGSIVQFQIDATSSDYSLTQPNFAGQIGVSLSTVAQNLAFQTSGTDPLWNEPAFSFTPPLAGPQVQAALQNLIKRENAFVYRPGFPNPQGQIFTDWSLLLQAITNSSAVFPVIEMDQGNLPPGQRIIIPPGGWNIPTGTLFRGNPGFGSNPTQVQFGDNANAGNDSSWNLPPGVAFQDILFYNGNINASPFTGAGGLTYEIELEGDGGFVDLSPPTGAAIVFFGFGAPGSQLKIFSYGSWQFLGGTSPGPNPRPIFSPSAPGSTVTLRLQEDSSIAGGSLAAGGGGTIDVVVMDQASCSFAQNPPITNPNAAGAVITYEIAGTYSRPFTQADLVANVLSVSHNLGSRMPSVNVVDNNGVVRLAGTTTTIIDENRLTFDVSPYAPILGTWSIGVTR